jgi:phospholipase/carboxylesterase
VLSTKTFGPDDAALTVVLLHGFGAPGDDLVPLGSALAPVLPARVRFVFPAAPIALGGMYGPGRAWWRIDLEELDREMRAGRLRDRRNDVPPELAAARAAMTELLDSLPAGRVVLGGFSQGAMLALDVALHRDPPPAGLVLMSGTLLAASEWTPRLPRLAGVPSAMSHGRHDPLLPFAIADELCGKLVAAGARVEWEPFDGGHEIPPPVLGAVVRLIAAVAAP